LRSIHPDHGLASGSGAAHINGLLSLDCCWPPEDLLLASVGDFVLVGGSFSGSSVFRLLRPLDLARPLGLARPALDLERARDLVLVFDTDFKRVFSRGVLFAGLPRTISRTAVLLSSAAWLLS
jgi:hypothetical protein